MTTPCLAEESLLALLLDDEQLPEERQHLANCPLCQHQQKRLNVEVETLRNWTSRPATHLDPPVVEKQPTNIGRYLVVGAIGAGGQGRVYRGLHPKLGGEVAIKWSSHKLDPDPSRRDALMAEGQLLFKLNHPHLVRVYDLEVQDDRPFLVMEYVSGGNLEERARQERISPQQAVAWVAQLAHGLATAHAHGITHQDVKPRNVFIDEADKVRLGDFGLARLQQTADPSDEPLGGTLAFMAPEQARKEVERIGAGSDIFGLGGVLYFLLTGKAPFEGDNPLLVRKKAGQCDIDWAPLQAAGAPAGLTAICRRALAPRPEDRYPSAEAMAQELERWLRRPKWTLRLLGGAAALVAACILGFVMFSPRPVGPLPTEVQPLITQIERPGGGFQDIRSAITLRSGDEFRISCDVPQGYNHVALLTVDAAGKVTRETNLARSPVGRFDRLTFPAEGALRQKGEPGTELVLVCASRSPIDLAAIEAQVAGRWPEMPAWAVLMVDREHVFVGSQRGHEETRGAGLTVPQDRLDEVRKKLADQCEYFAGVVYRYDR
jgi:eukaryotic-like serine/threonine-protein kinase